MKILITILCLILCTSCFSACKRDNQNSTVTSLPVATPNPNITNTKGEFYETNGELRATGGLSVLGDTFLKIMIDGKEHEFVLSDNVKQQIAQYNKDEDNLMLMKGTMLIIEYHKRNLIFVADSIEIVTAN